MPSRVMWWKLKWVALLTVMTILLSQMQPPYWPMLSHLVGSIAQADWGYESVCIFVLCVLVHALVCVNATGAQHRVILNGLHRQANRIINFSLSLECAHFFFHLFAFLSFYSHIHELERILWEMTCDLIHRHTHTHIFILLQDNKMSVRMAFVQCAVRALNEMNACAPPLPNYKEWRREISGGKEKKGCNAGRDRRKEWCATIGN